MGQPIADLSSLNGNFKYVYADRIQKLKPEDIYLLDDLPFTESQKIGRLYLQPVILTLSHGITFAPSSAVPNLNAAVTTVMQEAQVDGYQSILREQISYEAAARASGGGLKAFRDATQLIVENMRLSHMMKLETQTLYGQVGLATVASIAGNVITVTTAEWGPGIWTGGENMQIDDYTSGGAFVKTMSIVSIDLLARTLTVDNATGVSATDVLWFKGANGNEPAGIHKILQNTGTIFNISAGTFNLWKAVQYVKSPTGPLAFNDIQKAAAIARPKGMRGKIKVYVNPRAFPDLVNEIESARTFSGDKQYDPKLVERGTTNLRFYSTNGLIEIQVHDIVKEGYAYGLIMDGSWKRIGATDVTFRLPGRPQEEFFLELENSAGYELRSFADFAAFCTRIGANFIISGIVNTTP